MWRHLAAPSDCRPARPAGAGRRGPPHDVRRGGDVDHRGDVAGASDLRDEGRADLPPGLPEPAAEEERDARGGRPGHRPGHVPVRAPFRERAEGRGPGGASRGGGRGDVGARAARRRFGDRREGRSRGEGAPLRRAPPPPRASRQRAASAGGEERRAASACRGRAARHGSRRREGPGGGDRGRSAHRLAARRGGAADSGFARGRSVQHGPAGGERREQAHGLHEQRVQERRGTCPSLPRGVPARPCGPRGRGHERRSHDRGRDEPRSRGTRVGSVRARSGHRLGGRCGSLCRRRHHEQPRSASRRPDRRAAAERGALSGRTADPGKPGGSPGFWISRSGWIFRLARGGEDASVSRPRGGECAGQGGGSGPERVAGRPARQKPGEALLEEPPAAATGSGARWRWCGCVARLARVVPPRWGRVAHGPPRRPGTGRERSAGPGARPTRSS